MYVNYSQTRNNLIFVEMPQKMNSSRLATKWILKDLEWLGIPIVIVLVKKNHKVLIMSTETNLES